jgi:hypothetical protein
MAGSSGQNIQKSCIKKKKDITLIDNGFTVVKIFEGFFDYLFPSPG